MATHRKPLNTLRTPAICEDGWSANPGDPVAWTGAPANGTTITQYGNNTWPFNLASGFTYPNVATVEILSNLSPGTYYYVVASCPQAGAPKTVDVS